MPKKSPQQILEDKSRNRFEAALPDEWTVRDIPKDFGIDLEVEVFHKSDKATDATVETHGLIMKVQLKATATVKGSKPIVNVKVDHMTYWNNFDTPVLLVLYIEDQDNFYCKWAVSHDPGVNGWPKKFTTVSFDEEDQLTVRLSDFDSEILLLRGMRSGRLAAPIPLRFATDLDAGSGYKLARALRELIAEFELGDVVQLTFDNQQPAMELRINSNHMKTSMPLNSKSMTLHRSTLDWSVKDEPRLVVANGLILLAAHLSTLGSTQECVRLVEALWPMADACTVPDLAVALGAALTRGDRVDLALAIADHAVELGAIDESVLVATYLLPGSVRAHQLSETDFGSFNATVQKMIDQALMRGRTEIAGLLEFNLATALGRRKRNAEALPVFQSALTHRPQYETFEPYWGALGSNAFRAKSYELSAQAYRKAIELNPQVPDGRRYLADALLYAGRFEEALDVIEGSSDGFPALTDMLSVANRATLREIMTVLELTSQEKEPIADDDAATAEPNPDLAMRLLKERDALEPGLWLMLEPDHTKWTLSRATLLARLWLKWPIFWADAAIKAYLDEAARPEMFEPIVQMGFNDTQDDFIDALEQMLDLHASPEKAAIMAESFRIVGLPGNKRKPFALLASDRPEQPLVAELPSYGEDWSR